MTRAHCNPCASLAALVMLVSAGTDVRAGQSIREEVNRTIDRTVAVSDGMLLYLDHPNAGDVRMTTHARSEVRVTAHVRASAASRDIASEFVNAVKLDVGETPLRVTVRTTHPEMTRRYRDLGFAIDVDVLLPETMPVEAHHRFGNMSLAGLRADAKLRNESGLLSVADGRGRYELENRFGLIDATRLEGDLSVTNTNGGVRIVDATGTVVVRARFGVIIAERIRGALTAENTSGGVRGSSFDGPVTISARFGPVVLRDVSGRLDVRNSNAAIDVALGAAPCHDARLEAERAPIEVYVGEAGYSVTARTSAGRIRSEAPLTSTGPVSSTAVSGTIGGGGCSLALTTSNNDITISRGPAPAVDLNVEREGRAERSRGAREERAPRTRP